MLHSANASLLFLVFRRLTGAHWRSAFVAALFALHPLHVESVAWIAERKDVLSAFFFLLTLWAYAHYGEGRKQKAESRKQKAEIGMQKPATRDTQHATRNTHHAPRTTHHATRSTLPAPAFYVLSLLFFALGLMSKAMLVTLPFVLLLLDYWPLQRLPRALSKLESSARKLHPSSFILHPLLLEKLPFFALAAASCVITFLAQKQSGAVTPLATLPLDARLANAAVAYVQYLSKWFWPVNLSSFYPHPDHWGSWLVTGATAVLILLTAAVWRGRRRFPFALMGWLWFLGMLVPVIGIVQVGNQAFADRYTYLPLVGVMVALVWLAAEGIRRYRSANLLGLAVLATLAWCTRSQLATWKDTGVLFGHSLAVNPTSVQALYGYGAYLVDVGRLDEGKRFLEEAIRLHPDYPEALGTLGNTFAGQGKYAEAIRFYQAALKAQPDQEGVLNNLAWLLASCPDAAFRNGPEAVRLATRACELTGYAQPLLIGTLAAAQAEAGDFPAAIATAERAAALASALHLDQVAAKNRELLQLYRQGQPFHEKATTDGHG